METSLNIEVRGTGRDNSSWKRLAQTQQTVEMGLRCVLYWRQYPMCEFCDSVRTATKRCQGRRSGLAHCSLCDS
jgi:hypothetical protein